MIRWDAAMSFEDDYLDVLQNIEAVIVYESRKDGAILDMNVRDAIRST